MLAHDRSQAPRHYLDPESLWPPAVTPAELSPCPYAEPFEVVRASEPQR